MSSARDPSAFENLKTIKQSTHSIAYTASSKEDGEPAVILVNKTPLDLEKTVCIADSCTAETTDQIFHNDKYSKFDVSVTDIYRFEIISPCTQRDIDKYCEQEFCYIRETPQLYNSITKQFIHSIPESALKWVYDILDGSAEVENVFSQTESFVIVKDYKWNDPANLKLMHLLGLVRDRSLRSIRDLEATHLPLLKSIRSQGLQVLKAKFGLDPSKVRMFFHYLPTFYHLHVHFDHVSCDMTASHAAGKAIFLDDVIGNLEMNPNYYKEATITFTAGSIRDKRILELLEAHTYQ